MSKTKTNNTRSSNKKKTVKIILNVFFYAILSIIIAVLIYGIVLKKRGDQSFYVFGYRAMIVSSDSMSSKHKDYVEFLEGHNEQMQIGDLVITRKIRDDDELKIYDIVTFIDGEGRTVIHRIVKEEIWGNGKHVYTTRGDANGYNDALRARTQYEDLYVTNVHAAGKVIRALQNPAIILGICIGAIFLFLIAYLIKTIIKNRRERIKANTPIEPPDEKKIIVRKIPRPAPTQSERTQPKEENNGDITEKE